MDERFRYENGFLFKYAEDYPKQIDKILVLWDAVSLRLYPFACNKT